MRVLLKQGSRIETVSNVTLEDGYSPLVDGAPPSTSMESNIHIESALWYKTLLLNTVYIDCDDREVHWLRSEDTVLKTVEDECEPSRFVPTGTERLHSDIDVYDFDPTIDELADKANECMTLYGNRKITWKIFLSEVARLLHCYIFPAIYFKKQDIPALNEALLVIGGKSEAVERDILNKSKSIELTEHSLHSQRMRILKNEKFESEFYVRSCNKEFLHLFYKDLERDITMLSSDLEGIQLQVNKYRDCCVSEGMKLKLADLRKRRNESHDKLVLLQVARETLKNVLFRPLRAKKKKIKTIKVKQNVFHEIYVEVSDRLKKQKEDVQRACLKKVKISSVREAIFTALSDIRTSKDEDGSLPFTDGSEFFLDITGLNAKPDEWKTLEEKVYSELQTSRSPACQKHCQISKLIKDKISSAIDDCRMFSASSEHAGISENSFDLEDCELVDLRDVDFRALEMTGDASRRRRHHAQATVCTHELMDDIDPMAVDALKLCISSIKKDIKSQMESMCSLLIKSIPECVGQHYNKVWISYENVFYLEMLPHLCNLYELTYAPMCSNLFQTISLLSLQELLLDDHIINLILTSLDSDVHRSLNQMKLSSNSRCSEEFEILRPPSERSCVSLEIRKCTLEQLYTMADMECRQLKGSIPNMFDEHNCGPVIMEESQSAMLEENDMTDSDVSGSDADFDNDCFSDDQENVDPRTQLTDLFSSIVPILQGCFKAKTLLDKLRQLTRVFRSLGNLLSELSQQTSMGCCDEMLSIIIIMLRCLKEETFVHLYAHIQLLIDLRAPFLDGSVHDCSLTNFLGAFDYLFSSQVRKNALPFETGNHDDVGNVSQ